MSTLPAQRDFSLEISVSEPADRLMTIAAVANDVLWDIDLAKGAVWWSEGMLPVFGYGPEQVGPDTQWCHMHIHPEDRERVTASMRLACEDGSSVWRSEFRYLKADGSYAQVDDKGAIVRDEHGKAIRFMGAMQDISARRALELRQELLARELAHRVSNTLAVVQGLLRQTARSAVDASGLAVSLGQRIEAMANATTCLVNGDWQGADLENLAKVQLGAFLDVAKPQIFISGPKVWIRGDHAQSVALALNELATNAVKYGSLSIPNGRVSLEWSVEQVSERDVISIHWRECGGPPCMAPHRTGFGTVIIERGIADAKVIRTFATEGLTCLIELPRMAEPA